MHVRLRMPIRVVLAFLAAAHAGVCLATGCSSSESAKDQAAVPPEAGARDKSAVDVNDADPPCDPTKDLSAKVSDASIGDGASTSGVCLGCAKARCDLEIAHCAENCSCQAIVGDALQCFVETQQIGCAGALTSIFVTAETRKNALQLLGCIRRECPSECAVDAGAALEAGGAGSDADADAS